MKHIKSKLLNAEEFESELKDECKQCSRGGTKDRRCTVCNGKGKCTSCKGSGRTASYGFDRPKEWKPCRKCNGSGQCGKCNGEGVLKEKCMACAGTGKALSKTVATRVYRDSCKEIADAIASGVKANVGTRGIANAKEEEKPGDSPRETLVKGLFAHCCWLARFFSARSTRSTRLKSTPKTLRLCVRNELPLSHIRGRIWYNVCE